jgi:hypothetical protein
LIKKILTCLIWIVILLGIAPSYAVLAQAEPIIRLTKLDITAFPEVRLNFFAADDRLSPITDFRGLTLTENGEPITDFTVSRAPTGVEVFLIVDANSGILQVDAGQTLSRREIMRNSITRYATDFMGIGGQDRVHIVVPSPEGGGGVFLLENAGTPEEVVTAINAYEPDFTPAITPLVGMLNVAFTKALETQAEGRFQAVVLFSDARDFPAQINFGNTVAAANAQFLPIYTAILGNLADPDERQNANQLSNPTGGFWVHMPTPTDTDPLYSALQAHATQPQISYRSTIADSGNYDVALTVAGITVGDQFRLRVQPPRVAMALDNAQSLTRAGTAFNTPLAELDPQSLLLKANLTWLDRYPRRIEQAILVVDGILTTPTNTPVLNSLGEVDLEWNVAEVNAGNYAVSARITDELGLVSESDPQIITINVTRPDQEPTPSPEPPTPTPEPLIPLPDTSQLSQPQLLVGGVAFLFIVIGILLLWRRWRIKQDEKLEKTITSYLKVDDDLFGAVANEDEPRSRPTLLGIEGETGKYVLEKSVTTLGRDKELVDIVLTNPTVSRLHARIQEIEGKFWLYDEGSASGTYLNFERVGLTPQILADGDEIHVGRVQLKFLLPD